MSGDVHSPTNAGPDLTAEPPVPAFAASPPAAEGDTSPEVLVGAAFAGGLIAALILKRLVG